MKQIGEGYAKRCRCGINKKGNFESCKDIEGKRKTNCPCFRDGLCCELNHCFCLKCQNPFSQVEAM